MNTIVAILTRNIGVVLLPLYGLYTLHRVWKKRKISLDLVWLMILSSVTVATYLAIHKLYYNDYFYFIHEKIYFNKTKHLITPLKESYYDLLAIRHNNFFNETFMTTRGWNAVFIFFALIVTVIGIPRIK